MNYSSVPQIVLYELKYKIPLCIDDGGFFHKKSLCETTKIFVVDADIYARREAFLFLENLNDVDRCSNPACEGRRAFPVSLIRYVYEHVPQSYIFEPIYERTLDMPITDIRTCPCRKIYNPLFGEEACHTREEIEALRRKNA